MNDNRSSPGKLQIAVLSDVGRSRTMNQDYAFAGPLPGAEGWDLLAVADGLGGHAKGEWASKRTIEFFAGSLAAELARAGPREALVEAVTAANTVINQEARAQGAPGAATTLVAALCKDGQAWWMNVGDSRLYLLAAGTITQVSADHSWVGDQVRAGFLPPEAMHDHPNKNVVTRTVGFEASVAPEIGGPIVLNQGDALVLCSDGLHGPVRDEEIARAVSNLDPRHATERLVELANEAGGPDNITVIVGRIEAPSATQAVRAAPKSEQPGRSGRRRMFALVGAGLVVVAAAVAVAAWKLL